MICFGKISIISPDVFGMIDILPGLWKRLHKHLVGVVMIQVTEPDVNKPQHPSMDALLSAWHPTGKQLVFHDFRETGLIPSAAALSLTRKMLILTFKVPI